jgi:hypothetical protein
MCERRQRSSRGAIVGLVRMAALGDYMYAPAPRTFLNDLKIREPAPVSQISNRQGGHSSWHEVVDLNRLIAQCAEDLLFYSDDWWWTDEFLRKNRQHYVETVSMKAPHGGAQVLG